MTYGEQEVTDIQVEVAKKLFETYRNFVRKDLEDGKELFGEDLTWKELEWDELTKRTKKEYLQQARAVLNSLGVKILEIERPTPNFSPYEGYENPDYKAGFEDCRKEVEVLFGQSKEGEEEANAPKA